MVSELRARSRRALASSLVSVALAAAVTAATGPARAEPSLSDKETARSLMQQGDSKRDHADLAGALQAYQAADAIMHVPTTGLEVARTQAALGKLLEARESLLRVLRLPVKPGEPAPFVAARKSAEQMSEELGPRIPSVTVAYANVAPGQTPELTFDGEAVPAAAAHAPRKVNPGAHVVVAKLDGVERRQEVRVAEKESRTVTLDFEPAPAPVASVGGGAPGAADGAGSGGGPSTGKLLMFGGFGVGIVGIAVGSVTGLMSISKIDDVKAASTDGKVPPDRGGDLDAGRSLGTVSTIAFVVGGAGVAAGVVGIILSGKEKKAGAPETQARAHVRPVVGPTWLGLDGTF
jgi:hypothetical protein